MTLDDFFQIIESSVKQMIVPIALISSGYVLGVYFFDHGKTIEHSRTIIVTASILSGFYVAAMTYSASIKIGKLCNNLPLCILANVVYAIIFVSIYLGAIVLALNKAT